MKMEVDVMLVLRNALVSWQIGRVRYPHFILSTSAPITSTYTPSNMCELIRRSVSYASVALQLLAGSPRTACAMVPHRNMLRIHECDHQ